MSMIVRGPKEKIRKLREIAEEMDLEIVLYSDEKLELSGITSLQTLRYRKTKSVPTPRVCDAVRAVIWYMNTYNESPSAVEVCQLLDIPSNITSVYLNVAAKLGYLIKKPRTIENVKGRYVYKPNYDKIKEEFGEEFIEEAKNADENFFRRKRK